MTTILALGKNCIDLDINKLISKKLTVFYSRCKNVIALPFRKIAFVEKIMRILLTIYMYRLSILPFYATCLLISWIIFSLNTSVGILFIGILGAQNTIRWCFNFCQLKIRTWKLVEVIHSVFIISGKNIRECLSVRVCIF